MRSRRDRDSHCFFILVLVGLGLFATGLFLVPDAGRVETAILGLSLASLGSIGGLVVYAAPLGWYSDEEPVRSVCNDVE